MSALDNLKLSLSNLIHEFGSSESIGFALVINLGLAAIGVAVYLGTSGLLSFVGGLWAIINLLGIVAWVLRL